MTASNSEVGAEWIWPVCSKGDKRMRFWSQVWELGHRHTSRPHCRRRAESKPDTRAASCLWFSDGYAECGSRADPSEGDAGDPNDEQGRDVWMRGSVGVTRTCGRPSGITHQTPATLPTSIRPGAGLCLYQKPRNLEISGELQNRRGFGQAVMQSCAQ